METVQQYIFLKMLLCVILSLGKKGNTVNAYKTSFTIRVVLVVAINKLLFKLLGNKIKNKNPSNTLPFVKNHRWATKFNRVKILTHKMKAFFIDFYKINEL